jgi:RecJ-like exonuclease
MKCTTCNGSGRVTAEASVSQCPTCHGTGNLKTKQEDYVERMKEERIQLVERLARLTLFTMSPQMETLATIDQVLLCKQGLHMAKYLEVLNARIERA